MDPQKVFQEVIKYMEPTAKNNEQTLSLDLPHELPTVMADDDRVRQILLNLIGNAIKYSPTKGAIKLSAIRRNESLVISVEDTGRGISEEEQTGLFQPYYRIEAKESMSGLGLGLALSKKLVELQNGKIWVHSRKGVGSVFSFSLPIFEDQNTDEGIKFWRDFVKILVIEDDQQIVEAITLAFQIRWPEAKLIPTQKGARGAELVENENPDIVILDLGLPDINGYDVLKQISEFSDVPILILTARTEESDIVKGLEWGADDYMIKPFRQLELLSRIKALTRRRASSDNETPMAVGSLVFKPSTGQLTYKNKEINLTPTEGRLLHHMMRNAGLVVTHSSLADSVWGEDYPGAIDSLKVYIRRLREKLETNPQSPQLILTKPGVGYLMAKQG